MTKSSRFGSIEPLEARIAPALLINGANLLGGPHSPSTGQASVAGNSVTVVQVLSGEAIVWFQDGTIDGISFGPNTSLIVTGNVYGDIVGNLLPNGRLSDSDNNPLNGEDGDILLPNDLLGLKTFPLTPEDGSIGNIITGGSIENVTIAGHVNGMYAGDGAFNAASAIVSNGIVSSSLPSGAAAKQMHIPALDYNPIEPGVQSTFNFGSQSVFEPGAFIHNVTIAKADQFQAIAGSGNPNHVDITRGAAPAGGSISNVTITDAIIDVSATEQNAPPSYSLIAGDGGSGPKGGAGGAITQIVEMASTGRVQLSGGNGGDGASGPGGAGGSVSNLNLEGISSQYNVVGGNGGSGTPGGAGGSVIDGNYAHNTPSGSVILAADFTGDGAGDLLIADQGTSQMVLEKNNGSGTGFTPVIQYVDNNQNPVTLISVTGDTTPVAAAAVGGLGSADNLLVAYADSDTLVTFINQGNGVFWTSPVSGTPGYDTVTLSLSFSPAEMAVLGGGQVALAENIAGHSVIHLADGVGAAGAAEVTGGLTLPAPCVGLVSVGGTLYAALSNGNIDALSIVNVAGTPFNEGTTINGPGGLSSVDVDSTGTHLLALSAAGKTLEVFNSSGSTLTTAATVDLQSLQTTPEAAHFVTGNNGSIDRIALLSTKLTSSQINLYDLTAAGGTGQVTSVTPELPALSTSHLLTNFAVAYTSTNVPTFAALQSSLGQYTISPNFTQSFTSFALPFASKTVHVNAGNGGGGVDLGTKLGNGGAGGNIGGINADAEEIALVAGQGGGSETGGGGNGGSFTNPNQIKTFGSGTVAAQIIADGSVLVAAGDGGSPLLAGGKQAFGGAGGSLNGFGVSLETGENDLLLTLTGGNGGDGRGGAGGAGGGVTGIVATGGDGGLDIKAGDGGSALAGATSSFGNGGNGGSLVNITYNLSLDAQAAAEEKTHSASLVTGTGGSSIAGFGGSGGSLTNVSLTMQGANQSYDDKSALPVLVNAHLDSTVTVHVATGDGGSGTKGGNGGAVTGFQYTSVFSQLTRENQFLLGFTVMDLTAGNGGTGTTLNGGNGGAITLTKPISGITYYDPDAPTPPNNPNLVPLVVTAGNGGNGATSGGSGGAVTGLVAQNSTFVDGTLLSPTQLQSATVTAGNGGNGKTGNGGVGGAISNSVIGVEVHYGGGSLLVTAGAGGDGGTAGASAAKAKGGAGGVVSNSQFGLVSTTSSIGMEVLGGAGGSGVATGGLGGAVSGIQLNVSQDSGGGVDPYVLLIAGAGGDAHGAGGAAGKGGDVTNITEGKDENSAINLIQAGNGGSDAQGKGGAGGNATSIFTVGFIGSPSDNASGSLGVFDPNLVTPSGSTAQGLFSGRGGAGSTNGVNGFVMNIVARQIAAISAAEDPATGLFAAASKIQNVTADLIGYDENGDGIFDSEGANGTSPSVAVPIDGFILGAITNVNETGITGGIAQRMAFVFAT